MTGLLYIVAPRFKMSGSATGRRVIIIYMGVIGVPRGWVRRVQPPLNLQNFFKVCVCKIYCPGSAPILIQENVKMYTVFTFCFSFWGTSSQAPYQGFTPGPHWGIPSTRFPGPAPLHEPLHCKTLGTPMMGVARNLACRSRYKLLVYHMVASFPRTRKHNWTSKHLSQYITRLCKNCVGLIDELNV